MPAFSGAKGYGANASGGRGGSVVKVTSSNNSGTGTLREALSSGNRIVVFNVNIINLTSAITVPANVTLAGQTAGGVQVKGHRLLIRNDNIIMRGMMMRVGDDNGDSCLVGTAGSQTSNIMIDHCSFIWGSDDGLDLWRESHDVTISNCILGQGLKGSTNNWFAMTMASEPSGGDPVSTNVSIVDNLFALGKWRMPWMKHGEECEYINNYVYSPIDFWRAVRFGDSQGNQRSMSVFITGNYLRAGPNTDETTNSGDGPLDLRNAVVSSDYYILTSTPNVAVLKNGSEMASAYELRNSGTIHNETPEWASGITPIQADAARDNCLGNAGATAALVSPADGSTAMVRDEAEASIVTHATNITGDIQDTVAAYGGYPTPPSFTPPADADGDGMPDWFESANPSDDIEDFINSLYSGDGGGGGGPTYDYEGPFAFTGSPPTVSFKTYDYMEGGQGVAYNDSTAGLQSGAVDHGRTGTDVDGTNVGGIGWTEAGEWLQYEFTAPSDADYTVEIESAVNEPANGGGQRQIRLDFYHSVEDEEPYETTGTFDVPNTGSYLTFQWSTIGNVTLDEGANIMRLTIVARDAGLRAFRLTRIEVESTTLFAPGLQANGIPMLTSDGLPWMRSQPDNTPLVGAAIAFGHAPEISVGVTTETGAAAGEGLRPVTPEFDPVTLSEGTEITNRGVTYEFRDAAVDGDPVTVKWLLTPLGEPVLISDPFVQAGTVYITAISPASTVSDVQINGAMIDPFDPEYAGQGLDQAIANGQGDPSSYPWSDALNIDPAASGAIAITPGASFSVVKAIRSGSWSFNEWKPIEKLVVLTVMGSLPPHSVESDVWYRPGLSARGANMVWPSATKEELQLDVLRDLTAPAGLLSAADAVAEIAAQHLQVLPFFTKTGDVGRRAQIRGETPSNAYASVHGPRRAQYCCALHVDPDGDSEEEAAREALIDQIVQWAIDVCAYIKEGDVYAAGAGQHKGYIPIGFTGAFLLGDAAMVALMQTARGDCITQPFWTSATDVGFPIPFNTGSDGGGARLLVRPAESIEVDKPHWDKEPGQPTERNFSNIRLYGETWDANEVVAVCILLNGPSGETGAAAFINGANDTSNPRAASIAYMDSRRPMTGEASGATSHSFDSAFVALYDAWRDEISDVARWTGRPMAPEALDDTPVFSAGATAGTAEWTIAGWPNHSTLERTGVDLRISQDIDLDTDIEPIHGMEVPYQWVYASDNETLDPGENTSGTITGLRRGTVYHGAPRFENSAGWGPWSPSIQVRLPNPDNPQTGGEYEPRSQFTTLGTPSGDLVCDVDPVVLHKPWPAHEYPRFEPVTDATGVQVFYAGAGHWTGGTGALPAPSFEWERDTGGGFEAIPGATSRPYARTTADSGHDIRPKVTRGGVTAIGAAVSIPAATPPTGGTLADIDFTGEWIFNYPGVWASMQAGVTGWQLRPLPTSKMMPQATVGALWLEKKASGAELIATISTAAATATEYSVAIECCGGFFPSNSADRDQHNTVEIQILDGSDSLHAESDCDFDIAARAWNEGGVAGAGPVPGGVFHQFSGTFTTVSDQTVKLRIKISGGGQEAGLFGGLVLTKFEITTASGDADAFPAAGAASAGGLAPAVSDGNTEVTVPPGAATGGGLVPTAHADGGIAVEQLVTGSDVDLGGNSATFAIPASPAIGAGNALILVYISPFNMTGLTPPPGWTLVVSSANGFAHVFRKTAAGDEAGTSITITDLPVVRRAAFCFLEVSGGSGTVEAAVAAGLDPPSLTPAGGSAETAWIAALCGTRTDGTVSVIPAGYGDYAEIGAAPAQASNTNARAGACFKVSTAASDDPSAFTISVINNASSFTISVR